MRAPDATHAWQRRIHFIYRVGVLLKALDGLFEIMGGVGLLMVAGGTLRALVELVTRHELSEDPHDLVANGLMQAAQGFSADSRHFAAAYLLAHGALKVFLAGNLWMEKRWVYPVALWILGAFVAYQGYRLAHTGSLLLAAFTLVDVAILWAIWREWRISTVHAPCASNGRISAKKNPRTPVSRSEK